MTAFDDALDLQNQEPWWMIEIEGLQYRYANMGSGVDSVFDGWNPADSGFNQHVKALLKDAPLFGKTMASPLNGMANVPGHSFRLFDSDDEITDLLSTSDTPKNLTYLTANLTKTSTKVPVLDYSSFPSSGLLFIGRETISYSSKGTYSNTFTANIYTAQTADAGSTDVILKDAARTEAADYWVGALVTFTSGLNNGQSRFVVRSVQNDPTTGSPYSEDEITLALYFDEDNPFPNNISAGDNYSITMAPRRLYEPSIPGTGYEGAKIIITADTNYPENVGEVRYIKEWDGSADIMDFFEPLPKPATTGTTFTLVHYWFATITRAKFNSEAAEHNVTDKQGEVIPVLVSDKPQFIKTRRVWLHEYRQGCLETERQTRVGTIDDFALEAEGKSYSFKVSGLMKLLAKKILEEPLKAKVAVKNLWGGRYKMYRPAHPIDYEHREIQWPVMEDGSVSDYSVTEIYISSLESFPDLGNIKIGNEAIHYISKDLHYNQHFGFATVLVLGDHMKFDNVTFEDIRRSRFSPDTLPVMNRGLFADKIGLSDIQHEWVNEGWPENYVPPVPPSVCALMEEHKIGDEISQILVCDDSVRSDFPRYDELHISSTSGSITEPETITGDISGATATIMLHDDTNDILHVIDTDGTFIATEGITASGGFTATLDEIRLGNGNDLPARNNPLNVMLQILCSTGDQATNGKFDTLPAGWGLAIDEDFVDVDSIESLRDKLFYKTKIDFIIHKAISFKEWAEDNIFKYLQVWPIETNAGKIDLAYLYTEAEAQEEDENSALVAVDSSEWDARLLPDWTSGQEPVSKIVVKYNKLPIEEKFTGTLEINMAQSKQYLQEAGRIINIKCGVLYIPDLANLVMNPKDPELPELVARLINPTFSRHSLHPCPVIGIRLRYRNVRLQDGQLVKLTHPNLPNLRTGSRGFSGEYMQVMGLDRSPMQGFVLATLWQVGVHDRKYARKAPSAVVYSYAADTPSAGKSTVVLYDTIYNRSGNLDGEDFVADDVIHFLTSQYVERGSFGAEENETIESVSGSTIVLKGNMTNAPTQGNIMELATYDNSTSTRQSTRCHLADKDRTLGAAGDTAFKYQ